MATKVPAYSYDGVSSAEIKNGYWYIYLKTPGVCTFRMSYAKSGVEVFLVGGGGGGYSAGSNQGGGGGGGYTKTVKGISIAAAAPYSVTVGAGGAIAEDGGASSAFGHIVDGGKAGKNKEGGAGGSGGGGGGLAGQGGSDGSDGGVGWEGVCVGGIGQRTTTREFGEPSGTLYSGGGGGCGSVNDSWAPAGGAGGGGTGAWGYSAVGGDGAANTGGGGGGGSYAVTGGSGGSGIVIIRGTEDDFLPVYFDGRQLSEIFFNGEKLAGLIHDGRRIFAEGMVRLKKLIGFEAGGVIPV